MKILHGFTSLPPLHHPVATVGSYDGVHCGHRTLISEVVRRAMQTGGESIVLTFEPHPRITLGQDEGLKLLNTLEEKAILLESCGVDYMLVIPFDKAFSRLSHQEFITDYIVGRLGVKELIVGYNHRFGHNKGGNYAYLVERGAGLHVTEVAQHLVDEHKVSSTVIRNTIERGEMALAEELTGHPYIIIGNADSSGIVTTNPYKLLPPCGEYSATINGSNHMVHIKEGSVEVGEEFASQRVVIEL